MNNYLCIHCGKVVPRISNKAWVKSYCDTTGRTVHLQSIEHRTMTRRLTKEEVAGRLTARGLSWVGGVYETSRSRITVRCEEGHEFTVQAQGLVHKSGRNHTNGCRECDLARRFGATTQERVHPGARNHVAILYYTGHSWIPTEVRDTVTTTELNTRYGRNNWRLADD